jgi:hypothetical protein
MCRARPPAGPGIRLSGTPSTPVEDVAAVTAPAAGGQAPGG